MAALQKSQMGCLAMAALEAAFDGPLCHGPGLRYVQRTRTLQLAPFKKSSIRSAVSCTWR